MCQELIWICTSKKWQPTSKDSSSRIMELKIKAREISSKIMAKILEEITEVISNKSQKNLSRKLIRKPLTDC